VDFVNFNDPMLTRGDWPYSHWHIFKHRLFTLRSADVTETAYRHSGVPAGTANLADLPAKHQFFVTDECLAKR